MRLRRLPLAAALLAAAAAPAAAQTESRPGEDFTWSGQIPAGRWLYVRNMNGPVRVERGSGSQVEVQGRIRNRDDGRAEDIRFVAQKGSDGQSMVVCALWGDRSSCDDRGYRSDYRSRGNTASAELVVRLPAGVHVEATTVNGGVEVRGASAQVVARTVNGSVRAETEGGPVEARTVNGSIDARMSAVGSARELSFESVNGSVSVAFPQNLGAELDLSTVNGRVSTDFPITLTGRIDPRHLRATIGDGSRRVRVRTVNGSVSLKRAG